MNAAFIYRSIRTPFGKYGGALAEVRSDDLGARTIAALLAAVPTLDPAAIDDVIFGNANGAGEENRNVGRMASLLAGLPVSVPGTTVNRLCGSSLDAAMMASRMIETGDARVTIVGGVESMSRSPWVLPKPAKTFPARNETLVSTTLGWRLVNPAMPPEWTVTLGEANEQLRDRYRITRERQDEFALRSHRLAAQAWTEGFYEDLTFAIGGLSRDEGIRDDASTASLSKLRPAFREDGSITAGNASPLSDGAAACLIAAEGAVSAAPLARIAGRGISALEPQMFGYAPVEAANRALAAAGIGWGDIGAVELNEAFAVQSLACLDAWEVDPEIVNTRGGAIAMGHPLGASGARILGTLAAVLRERHEQWGVAAICIGVGQGLAVVLENVAS